MKDFQKDPDMLSDPGTDEEQLEDVVEAADGDDQDEQDNENDDSESLGDEDTDDDDFEEEEEESDSEEETEKSEAGPSTKKMKMNPLYNKNKGKNGNAKKDDEDSDSDVSVSDDDDDSDEDEDKEEDGEDKTEPDLDNDEDALIKALKKAKEKRERAAPPDIVFSKTELSDISFHPTENDRFAVATLEGDIMIYKVTNESNEILKKISIHKKSVRTLEFDLKSEGRFLLSGSKDKSLKVTDMETAQVCYKIPKAHDSALYKVRPIDENLFASGDEDGVVKLWDRRMKNTDEDSGSAKPAMEASKFDEFVSDIFVDEDAKLMVASSGEGTIHSFNIRGRKPDVQSEVYEGEMNCLAGLVHRDSKLVAGCGDGRLYMFNWGEFGYHSADFPGHPDAINDLVQVTENVVISACEDGSIRAVNLYPHRFLGAVGHHEGKFPVEKLDISSDGDVLASISHDKKVKFWNIKYLEQMDYDKTAKPYNNRSKKYKVRRKEAKMGQAKEKEHQLPSSNKGNSKDFFSGL